MTNFQAAASMRNCVIKIRLNSMKEEITGINPNFNQRAISLYENFVYDVLIS